jgi:hypothetical protein
MFMVCLSISHNVYIVFMVKYGVAYKSNKGGFDSGLRKRGQRARARARAEQPRATGVYSAR